MRNTHTHGDSDPKVSFCTCSRCKKRLAIGDTVCSECLTKELVAILGAITGDRDKAVAMAREPTERNPQMKCHD